MLYHDFKKKRITALVLYLIVLIFPHMFLIIGLVTSPEYILFIIPLYLLVTLIMTGYLLYYLENIRLYYIDLVVKVHETFKKHIWVKNAPIKKIKRKWQKESHYRYQSYVLSKAFIKSLHDETFVPHDFLDQIHSKNIYHLKALSKPYDYALIKDSDHHYFIVSFKDLSLYKEKS